MCTIASVFSFLLNEMINAYKMLCEYWGEDFVKEVETEQRTEAFSGAVGESVRTERE